ncbi:hypothetical protein Leryth_009823 [Lithospermum erythrorhizon]|nr:hypothetical protein Leryth_009823 [Lithospermum erythrorhizon]
MKQKPKPPLTDLTNNLNYSTKNINNNNASDACSNNYFASESDLSIGSPHYKSTHHRYSMAKMGDGKSGVKNAMTTVVAPGNLPAVTRNNKVLAMPLGKSKSKMKVAALPSTHSTVLKWAKERAKATVVPPGDIISQTKNKEKGIVTRQSLNPVEFEDIGKSIAMYSNCQHPLKFEENMKKEVAVLSFSLLGTSTMRKRSNDIKKTGPINSWMNPHPKKVKKRSIRQETDREYSLPRDYCEKQRAYYKEVDDFELLEEEISYQDLNKW